MHDRGGRKGGAWHQGNGYLSPTRLRALRFPGSRRIVCVYSGVKERKVPRSGGALLGVSRLQGYKTWSNSRLLTRLDLMFTDMGIEKDIYLGE